MLRLMLLYNHFLDVIVIIIIDQGGIAGVQFVAVAIRLKVAVAQKFLSQQHERSEILAAVLEDFVYFLELLVLLQQLIFEYLMLCDDFLAVGLLLDQSRQTRVLQLVPSDFFGGDQIRLRLVDCVLHHLNLLCDRVRHFLVVFQLLINHLLRELRLQDRKLAVRKLGQDPVAGECGIGGFITVCSVAPSSEGFQQQVDLSVIANSLTIDLQSSFNY